MARVVIGCHRLERAIDLPDIGRCDVNVDVRDLVLIVGRLVCGLDSHG